MKVNIEIELPENVDVTPFEHLKDALGALLAFKTLNKTHGYSLPDVSIKAGGTSLNMKCLDALDNEHEAKPTGFKLAQIR